LKKEEESHVSACRREGKNFHKEFPCKKKKKKKKNLEENPVGLRRGRNEGGARPAALTKAGTDGPGFKGRRPVFNPARQKKKPITSKKKRRK